MIWTHTSQDLIILVGKQDLIISMLTLLVSSFMYIINTKYFTMIQTTSLVVVVQLVKRAKT